MTHTQVFDDALVFCATKSAVGAAFIVIHVRHAVDDVAPGERADTVHARALGGRPDDTGWAEAIRYTRYGVCTGDAACMGYVGLALHIAFHQLLHATSFETGVMAAIRVSSRLSARSIV